MLRIYPVQCNILEKKQKCFEKSLNYCDKVKEKPEKQSTAPEREGLTS